ncbi:cysteine hydrolase family protein [Haloarchaeobius amylolyticus]|uniref:Cysteine hydrolase family protein n=1 Tax=Haloarchaeobius amylolyticus TaxID=1198296 RepID=A0ABD6BM78_9EURY
MSDAVILLDMLNDFVTGEIEAERAQNIIPTLRDELLPAAREHDIPVIYANDAHRPEDFELEVWGEHAMRGTAGAEVIPELEPEADDHIFEKRFYDAFYGTGLDQHLRSLGVDRLVMTGLHTNMCVRHSSATGFFNGYEIVVPEDCVDAFTEDEHEQGLDYLERVYNAELTTATALIEEWEAA